MLGVSVVISAQSGATHAAACFRTQATRGDPVAEIAVESDTTDAGVHPAFSADPGLDALVRSVRQRGVPAWPAPRRRNRERHENEEGERR